MRLEETVGLDSISVEVRKCLRNKGVNDNGSLIYSIIY